jgi:hypothetical protein
MAGLPLAPTEAPLAQPPRVGLLPTLSGGTVVSDARTVGFTFDPENCGESGVGNPELCNTDNDKPIPDNPDVIEAEPFYIWAGDKCSPQRLSRDWQGRARRQLAATESYQVARELWRGDEAQTNGWPNRYLAHEDSDVVTSGPTSATDALARLEYALGDCVHGARGMVHATRHAVTYWHQLGLVRREGNLLLTIHDTLVVPDAGYDGSGPNGQAADEDSQWAYATGMVIARLGPEQVVPDGPLAQAVDRATNTVEYRAERLAAVGWDGCCHLAAELDLGWAAIGGLGS